MVHWTPQHWPVSLLGYPQNCLSNVWSFRTMGSQPQDNFIDHKITAFMNWLIFLHTIIFLLSMPLTVATFTSCHVLGTSLAAHWPATRQLMPARRMALWSHLPCLSGWCQRAHPILLRKTCLLHCHLPWKSVCYWMFCFNGCCYHGCKCKSVFTLNMLCGSKIQRKIPANANTSMHSDLLTSGFARSWVEHG